MSRFGMTSIHSRKAFYIQCENCMTNDTIMDGYNNEDSIQINIVGEQLVELRCSSCENLITTISGKNGLL